MSKKVLDNMFSEFDETECVMIAADIEEAAIDHDVKKMVDDDEGDHFDRTIEDLTQTFTMEDIPAQEYRETADTLIANESEDAFDEAVINLLEGDDPDFDDDVEDMVDDDDDEYDEDVEDAVDDDDDDLDYLDD